MENNFDDIKNLEKKVLTDEEREKELKKIRFLIVFVSFFIFLFVFAFLYINGFIFKKKNLNQKTNIIKKVSQNNLYLTTETNLTNNKEAIDLVNDYHLEFLYEDEYKESKFFTAKELYLKDMSEKDKTLLLNISSFFKTYLKNNALYDCDKKIVDKSYLEEKFYEKYAVKINIDYFLTKISFDTNKVLKYKDNSLSCIYLNNKKFLVNKLYHIEKNKNIIKYYYKKYFDNKESDSSFILVFKYNEKQNKYILEKIENA